MVLWIVTTTNTFVRAGRLVQDLHLRVEVSHIVIVVHAHLGWTLPTSLLHGFVHLIAVLLVQVSETLPRDRLEELVDV